MWKLKRSELNTRHFIRKMGKRTTCTICTQGDTAEVFVNGQSVGILSVNDNMLSDADTVLRGYFKRQLKDYKRCMRELK